MDIHPARSEDELSLAVDILEQASAWMRARSGGGWPERLFPDDVENHGPFWQAYEDGDLYLAWDDGEDVATVILQEVDEVHWPGAARDAVYVHKLAVRPEHHGRGIGSEILRWAEREARGRRKRFLRLDTGARNARLRRYYADAGFELRGERDLGAWVGVLFEREIDAAASTGSG